MRSPTRWCPASSARTTRTASGRARAASSAPTRRSPRRSRRCPSCSARGSASSPTAWRGWASSSASQRSREQLLRNLAALGPEAAAGAQALVGLSLFFAYSIPDPATGVNPFWAEFGYPGPGAPPGAAAEGRGRARPRVRRGRLRGRRRGGRLGRRRRGDRRGARRGRPARDRARGGRPVRRGRLQRLRAVGLPEPLLARRAESDRRHERLALRGRRLRRRHHDQLDQLPAHQALGARAVGARARPRGARRPRVRPPPRRGLGAPVGQRPLLAT